MTLRLPGYSSHKHWTKLGPYNPKEDEQDAPDLDLGDDAAKRAYIEQLIAIAADDVKTHIITATVAVGTVIFLIKDSASRLQQVGGDAPTVAAWAAGVLLVGAGFLYWYAAEVNLRRFALARCLASCNAKKARALWSGNHGIKTERGLLLLVGTLCLGAGLLLSAIVTWVILTGTWPIS